MPTGVYKRTEKHSFNLGKKHPNRKRTDEDNMIDLFIKLLTKL